MKSLKWRTWQPSDPTDPWWFKIIAWPLSAFYDLLQWIDNTLHSR